MLLFAFQGNAALGVRARPKIWQPTAVRTFFQVPEEYCSQPKLLVRGRPPVKGLNTRGPLKVQPEGINSFGSISRGSALCAPAR
jgi:hypothetical protein